LTLDILIEYTLLPDSFSRYSMGRKLNSTQPEITDAGV